MCRGYTTSPPQAALNRLTRKCHTRNYCRCLSGDWAEAKCHLYCWATNATLPRAFELVAAGGFAHKSVLTWVKKAWGLGSYFRQQDRSPADPPKSIYMASGEKRDWVWTSQKLEPVSHAFEPS